MLPSASGCFNFRGVPVCTNVRRRLHSDAVLVSFVYVQVPRSSAMVHDGNTGPCCKHEPHAYRYLSLYWYILLCLIALGSRQPDHSTALDPPLSGSHLG